jgi:hypothetical protein
MFSKGPMDNLKISLTSTRKATNWTPMKSTLQTIQTVNNTNNQLLDDELDEKADREINDDSVSIASSSLNSELQQDSDFEVTPFDFTQLPVHHCSYCGIHSA